MRTEPAPTKGQQMAAKARKICNKLTPEQREVYREVALAMVYPNKPRK